MIITTDLSKVNITKLKEKCEPVSTIEEGEEIAAKLLKALSESKNGIGLAANQIGINKRVCVINVKEPLILINPEIIGSSEEWFVFPEGCLSFPNKKELEVKCSPVLVKEGEEIGVRLLH